MVVDHQEVDPSWHVFKAGTSPMVCETGTKPIVCEADSRPIINLNRVWMPGEIQKRFQQE